jgi:GntR family transcriptional regulator
VINLNYRDSRPIYEQIKDGLRKLVMTGAFSPDERLPSVRELASALAINPNTIQRAYKELEAEGYIYTTAGKGSFVSDMSGVDSARRSQQLKKFEEAVIELLFLGTHAEELKSRIDSLSKDSGGGL